MLHKHSEKVVIITHVNFVITSTPTVLSINELILRLFGPKPLRGLLKVMFYFPKSLIILDSAGHLEYCSFRD